MKQALKGLGIEALADIDTPLGRMTALATPAGLAALWFDARERYAAQLVDAVEDPDHPHIAAARRWLEAYWADAGTDTITVPLDLHGTLFQRAAFHAATPAAMARWRRPSVAAPSRAPPVQHAAPIRWA